MSDLKPTVAVMPSWLAIERVVRSHWSLSARSERDAGSSLLALWADDRRDLGEGYLLRAAYLGATRLRVVELVLDEAAPAFPSLAEIYPCAARMERAVQDLLGLSADGADQRAWLRHAAWPAEYRPLRHDTDTAARFPAQVEDYAFVRVEGDGVHEIAVGPVHAGTIEPGHFRFSVVGEKVLRLEQRLGYVHKGIEQRFRQMGLQDGQRLAARVSGDTAVAYSWAYCMALEQLCGASVPQRAQQLRAVLLERERIANHLGDLGALGNDAGFGFGLSQFSLLKERWLRANAEVYGARYPMDGIVPGGVAADLSAAQIELLREQGMTLEAAVAELRSIYDEHAGVQDRFVTTGRMSPELAQRLGVIGLAARASGSPRDLRCDLALAPYTALGVQAACSDQGDVAARVAVRFDEVIESLRLCDLLLQNLADGAVRVELGSAAAQRLGIGLVEGWRGPVMIALEANADGGIRRCHPHDPSWQNWPALEHAIIGNIVPDFPLINKSFNLSYSGQDL
jgi:Ni,Fe-hydrogenase III large subunit/Ni,Fe-hydrogenase III component G